MCKQNKKRKKEENTHPDATREALNGQPNNNNKK